jgi:hypothetical protein
MTANDTVWWTHTYSRHAETEGFDYDTFQTCWNWRLLKSSSYSIFLYRIFRLYHCPPVRLLVWADGRGTVARADSTASAELQGAPKPKLLQLKNIQKYHWVKHKEMLIFCLDVPPNMYMLWLWSCVPRIYFALLPVQAGTGGCRSAGLV